MLYIILFYYYKVGYKWNNCLFLTTYLCKLENLKKIYCTNQIWRQTNLSHFREIMIFRTNLALILSLIAILGVANGRYLLIEIDQDNTQGKCVYVFTLSLNNTNYLVIFSNRALSKYFYRNMEFWKECP